MADGSQATPETLRSAVAELSNAIVALSPRAIEGEIVRALMAADRPRGGIDFTPEYGSYDISWERPDGTFGYWHRSFAPRLAGVLAQTQRQLHALSMPPPRSDLPPADRPRVAADLLREVANLEAGRDELLALSAAPAVEEVAQPPGDGDPILVDLSGAVAEHLPTILGAMDHLLALIVDSIVGANPTPPADAGEPPEIPRQGSGLRFAIQSDGKIGVAPPEPLDGEGNDLDHLRGIYPALQEAAADLAEALRSGNRPPDAVLPVRAEAYRRLVAGPLGEPDVHRLYAAGRRLERAEEATAAEIAADNEPPLTAKEREAIAALRSLHRGFVMATRSGRRANAYEAAYDRRGEPTPGEAGVAVLDAIQRDVETFTPEVIGEARDAAGEIVPGREGTPGAALGASTFGNLLSVTVKAALAATAATVLALELGAVGSAVGTAAMWLALERLKKAPEFDAVTRRYAKAEAAALLARPLGFVLRHEPELRRLADRGGAFAYIHPALDWIKWHRPPAA